MKAAIWHGKNDVRVEETDLSEPKKMKSGSRWPMLVFAVATCMNI